MKKNKRVIIITIIAIIVIITGIIVGISINNHNTAVKEALSVSESKQNVCDYFDEEYKSVVNKEHKTVEDYSIAKDTLVDIKDNINKSDIKDDERLVSLISNIDKTIEEYDVKVKELTTTTTESTTEVTTEATTEKEDKPVNATTRKSNSLNNSTTKSNKSNNTTKATQPKTTAKQTTTSNKITPAYGTVLFSSPNDSKYIMGNWHTIDFIWYWNGREWDYSYTIGMGDEKYKNELIKYAKKSFPSPNYEGKVGDQVSKFMYIWLD